MLRFLLTPTLLACCTLQAQHVLVLEADTVLPRQWQGAFNLEPAAMPQRTAALRMEMISNGYLAASCDSCTRTADTLRCHFHLGTQFRWGHLTAGNLPPEIASEIGRAHV